MCQASNLTELSQSIFHLHKRLKYLSISKAEFVILKAIALANSGKPKLMRLAQLQYQRSSSIHCTTIFNSCRVSLVSWRCRLRNKTRDDLPFVRDIWLVYVTACQLRIPRMWRLLLLSNVIAVCFRSVYGCGVMREMFNFGTAFKASAALSIVGRFLFNQDGLWHFSEDFNFSLGRIPSDVIPCTKSCIKLCVAYAEQNWIRDPKREVAHEQRDNMNNARTTILHLS